MSTPLPEPKTIQLRRYAIAPEYLDDFMQWWNDLLLPARASHGFTLEFAVLDRPNAVLTWAVSLPADAEEFARRDEDWAVSPERMAALAGTPQRVTDMRVSIVEPLIAAS